MQNVAVPLNILAAPSKNLFADAAAISSLVKGEHVNVSHTELKKKKRKEEKEIEKEKGGGAEKGR